MVVYAYTYWAAGTIFLQSASSGGWLHNEIALPSERSALRVAGVCQGHISLLGPTGKQFLHLDGCALTDHTVTHHCEDGPHHSCPCPQ